MFMIRCRVNKPMYAVGTRKYMKIELQSEIKNKIYNLHREKNFEGGMDPLVENILAVKVPYRYRRVDCKVLGLTPVEDLTIDDEIFAHIQFCGAWRSGLYWRFELIQKIDPPGGS